MEEKNTENKGFPLDMLRKVKVAKNVQELFALAKENKIDMTIEQAEAYFAEIHLGEELGDDELDGVSGGENFKAVNSLRINKIDITLI